MEDIWIAGDVENFLICNNETVLFRDWLVIEMDKISRLINCLYRCAYKSLVDKGMCQFATFVRSMIFDWQQNRDILTKRKFLGLYDVVSVTHRKFPFKIPFYVWGHGLRLLTKKWTALHLMGISANASCEWTLHVAEKCGWQEFVWMTSCNGLKKQSHCELSTLSLKAGCPFRNECFLLWGISLMLL